MFHNGQFRYSGAASWALALGLAWACAWGWVELAELLIKHRAEVNKEDPEGTTPMLAAAARGRAGVIQLLPRHDAKTGAAGGGRHGPALLHI